MLKIRQFVSKSGDKISYFEWTILSILIFIALSFFSYSDLRSITIWNLNFFDVLFSGRLYEFYSYTALNLHDIPHQYAGGPIFAIALGAIPLLPLWITRAIFGFEVTTSFFAMFYTKFVLGSVYLCSVWFGAKIAQKVGMKQKYRSHFFFLCLSSIFFLSGVGYSGQNDVYCILLGVLGIYFLLQEKRGLFLVFFTISIILKPFIILVFLAVVLLTEKKLIKIFCFGLVVVFSVGIAYTIFLFAPEYSESLAAGPIKGVLSNLLSARFLASPGEISAFIVAYVSLLVICYLTNIENNIQGAKTIVYYSFATMALYFLFSPFEPYRIIMLLPFMCIIMLINMDRFRINLALDIVISGSYMVCAFTRYWWCYAGSNLNNMLVSKIMGKIIKPYSDPLFLFFAKVSIVNIAVGGFFFVALALFLVVNHPQFKFKFPAFCATIDIPLLWIRSFMMFLFFMISAVSFIMA